MQYYIKNKKHYNEKAKASPLKGKDCFFILQPKANHQGSKTPFRDFRWIGPYVVEKVPVNNNYIVRKLNTNKTKSYAESASESTILKNRLKRNIRKLNGSLTIISLFHKMIYTPLHGERNLVDTFLTFLSHILTPTQLILMKVTHTILLLSRAPIFMIQAMVKAGKLASLLTHLWYILQILNRMVKVKTLRPSQTYIILIVPNKHLSQARTSELHMNLYNNHHRDRVTTLQRLRSTILPQKFFRKTKLVILETAKTTYTLTLILITQQYTDTDVRKSLFQPFSYAIIILYFFFFRTHINPLSCFLYFCGQIHINTSHPQKRQYLNKQSIIKQFYSKIQDDSASEVYQLTKQPHHYGAFFQYQYVDVVMGDDFVRVTSLIQMQAHSNLNKTPHHSQPSQLYLISPIQLEFFHICEYQLTPMDYIQTVGLYHKSSQATPNTMK